MARLNAGGVVVVVVAAHWTVTKCPIIQAYIGQGEEGLGRTVLVFWGACLSLIIQNRSKGKIIGIYKIQIN